MEEQKQQLAQHIRSCVKELNELTSKAESIGLSINVSDHKMPPIPSDPEIKFPRFYVKISQDTSVIY